MKTMKLAIVTAACALAACNFANAAFNGTFTSVVGGAPTEGGRINFDDLTGPGLATGPNGSVNVSFITDGQVVTSGSPNTSRYAAPWLSGANGTGFGNTVPGVDTTTYLTSGTGLGRAILTFGSDQTYLGLLWGSIDTYNTLEFYNNGQMVDSLTGTQVISKTTYPVPFPAGNQQINGTAYVNIYTGFAFDEVRAASTSSYAFEFDNIAVVPEPTTVVAGALLLLPFGASTLRSLRRKA